MVACARVDIYLLDVSGTHLDLRHCSDRVLGRLRVASVAMRVDLGGGVALSREDVSYSTNDCLSVENPIACCARRAEIISINRAHIVCFGL